MAILSPRSNNYERLEGGLGPSRGTSKKFAWKKFAILAVVIVGGVYLFAPRRGAWRSTGTKAPQTYPYADDIEGDPLSGRPKPPPSPPDIHKHPKTFAEDTDPTKTTHCTSPHSSSSRLVQYALMIDAGSTGSRIHIYKFNNCGPSPAYEYEVFKMIQGGLSSFAGRPEDAAKSLDILLEEAVRVVPEGLRGCTPVAVKATAGLRLLGAQQSKDILEAVEKRIRTAYPFPLPDTDGVVIMDGKDEGVYAWITANYLLGTIKADTPRDTPTYAVLDLGGASTQIVFEPTFSSSSALEPGEHKYDLQFGGKKHVLYQHSYLGYGLMRARRHVHTLVDFMASLRVASGKEKSQGVVGNPCLAKGTTRVVEISDERTGEKRKVTMDGDEIGSFEACERVVQLVLAKDSICELKPCSFNGVYQPSLLDSFPRGKVLLLSYFYDRLAPLIPLPALSPSSSSSSSSSSPPTKPALTVSTFASLARQICPGPSSWATQPWSKDPELMQELHGRPEWCLDLTFMYSLLRLGYEFGDDRQVALGKQVEGTELGWCLGAAIGLVGGSEVRCRD